MMNSIKVMKTFGMLMMLMTPRCVVSACSESSIPTLRGRGAKDKHRTRVLTNYTGTVQVKRKSIR